MDSGDGEEAHLGLSLIRVGLIFGEPMHNFILIPDVTPTSTGGLTMQNQRRLFLLVVIVVSSGGRCVAQLDEKSAEPAIPVYMICPFHEDSLRNLYGNALYTAGPPFIALAAKSDSLSHRLLASENAMNEAWNRRLTLLYVLVGGLATLNIFTLKTTQRLRKELSAQRASSVPAGRLADIPAGERRELRVLRKARSKGRNPSGKRR